MDKVLYNGSNIKVHNKAQKFHDKYVMDFYKKNKGVTLYANTDEEFIPVGYDGQPLDTEKPKKTSANSKETEKEDPAVTALEAALASSINPEPKEELEELQPIIVNVDDTAKVPVSSNRWYTPGSKYDLFALDGKVIKKKSNDDLYDIRQFLWSDDLQVKHCKKQLYKIRQILKREMEKRNMKW